MKTPRNGKPDGQVLVEALLWISLMIVLFSALAASLGKSGKDFTQAVQALEEPLPR
jgi:hypothetical protein